MNANKYYTLDPNPNNNLADDETVKCSNCKEEFQNKVGVEIAFNITRVTNKPKDNKVIVNTGITDHFLKESAPAGEILEATKAIEIEILNDTCENTHTCYLRVPGLPKELRKGHIVPGLSHSSLVSIKRCVEENAKLSSMENIGMVHVPSH